MAIQGPLSPNMINAASGITPSPTGGPPPAGYYSLGVATTLINAVDAYRNVSTVKKYREAYVDAVDSGKLTGAALSAFRDLGITGFPALTDAAVYESGTFTGTKIIDSGNFRLPYSPDLRFMSDLVLSNARLIMGYDFPLAEDDPRDLSKFAQIQSICESYRTQTNTILNSTKNSEIMATTFVNMESISTGGVSLISSEPSTFGTDLLNLGNLVNLQTLNYLGYPSNLLRQMESVGGLLPGVYDAMILVGVSPETLLELSTSSVNFALDIELKMYRGLMMVTGDNLDQVLQLLDVSSANTDYVLPARLSLDTAADLLNPKKILPNSYNTLVVQAAGACGENTLNTNVYTPNGSVNSVVSNLFVDDDLYLALKKVIPPDQALANTALIRSMKQVKNVTGVDFSGFAAAAAALDSPTGLTEVDALTEPVPATVQTAITDALATGTGLDGTLTLYDFIGTAAGWVHANSLTQATVTLDSLDTSALVALYDLLINTINGVYTTPSGPPWVTVVPGGGTYTSMISANDSISQAINDMTAGIGLVPQIVAEVAAIISANPTQVTECNTLWSSMASQFNTESENRYLAELIFDFVTDSYTDITANSRSAVLALIDNLHSVGTEISANGPADFFRATAQTSNLGGQSVIASLSEGRNIQVLADAGIGVDTQLPSTPYETDG